MSLKQRYGNLQTFFDQIGFDKLSELESDERLFTYFMSRAALDCYGVCFRQFCPNQHSYILIHIAKYLVKNHENTDLFYEQLRQYFFYLFCNYGVHFVRETENNKRTPSDLGFHLLTKTSMKNLVFGDKLTPDDLRYLFDKDYFPTRTVLGNIEKSGGNFYSRSVKNEDYDKLTEEEKTSLNAYYLKEREEVRYYGAHKNGVCKTEFSRALKNIEQALIVAKRSERFDEHTVASLKCLITFLKTGDEIHFKEHSKHWLKMNNRVEYCFGLIEYYDDPQTQVGTFQADVTVKSLSVDSLIKLLPSFEKRFPFPDHQKRSDMSNLPNASTAHKLMGVGGLGPTLHTIAYCLPNYNDIRSELGSKQIMYTLPRSSDIERYKNLYLSNDERIFYDEYSPDLSLDDKVTSLMTTLHETIGHASGGSNMTETQRKAAIGSYWNGLEEMRAEILACYTAITFYDEIAESGILGDWPNKVSKKEMQTLFIKDRANCGWLRWVDVPEGSTEVVQAHGRADTAIMYYLIDGGGITLNVTTRLMDGEEVTVLETKVKDLNKAMDLVEELAKKVQELSSEPTVESVDEFMKTYALSTRNKRYSGIVRNMQKINGKGVEAKIQVFPEWETVKNVYGEIVDAVPYKPQDPVDAALKMLRYSCSHRW